MLHTSEQVRTAHANAESDPYMVMHVSVCYCYQRTFRSKSLFKGQASWLARLHRIYTRSRISRSTQFNHSHFSFLFDSTIQPHILLSTDFKAQAVQSWTQRFQDAVHDGYRTNNTETCQNTEVSFWLVLDSSLVCWLVLLLDKSTGN